MTDEKQPQPGEWWRSDDGDNVRVVGRTIKGEIVYETEHDGLEQVNIDFMFDWFHHEPDCTGFDWLPEDVKPKTRTVTLHEYVVSYGEGRDYLTWQTTGACADFVGTWYATGNTRIIEVPV